MGVYRIFERKEKFLYYKSIPNSMEGERSEDEGSKEKIKKLKKSDDLKDIFESYEREIRRYERKRLIILTPFFWGTVGTISMFMFTFVLPPIYQALTELLGTKIIEWIVLVSVLLFISGLLLISTFGGKYIKAWGTLEKRLLLYAYGIYKYRFEEKSKYYLRDLIYVLEDQATYAREMIFFDKERQIEIIIDTLKKYIFPNLGKKGTYNEKQNEVIEVFREFSLKMYDSICQKNRGNGLLGLLMQIEENKGEFTPGAYYESEWEPLKLKFENKLGSIKLKLEKDRRWRYTSSLFIGFLFILLTSKFHTWEITEAVPTLGFIVVFLDGLLKK